MSDSETRLLLEEKKQKKSKLYIEKKSTMETTPKNSNVKYDRFIGTPSPLPSYCGHAEKKINSRNVKKILFPSKKKIEK